MQLVSVLESKIPFVCKMSKKLEILVITGKINSGKTTLMKKLFEMERLDGKSPTGIISPGVFRGDAKIGFDVIDLSTGRASLLARVSGKLKNGFSVGRFTFSDKSLEFAKKAILDFRPGGTVFVDEIGPLELTGKGYADCLRILLKSSISKLYISVRENCLDEVRKSFLSSRKVTISYIST